MQLECRGALDHKLGERGKSKEYQYNDSNASSAEMLQTYPHWHSGETTSATDITMAMIRA